MTHPKIILASVLIFLAGAVAGGVLVRELDGNVSPEEARGESCLKPSRPYGNSHWEDKRKDFLHHMSRELDLSHDQENEIDAILQDSQDNMEELLNQVSPAMKAVFHQTENEIRSVLSPDQQSKFDEMIERHRKKEDDHKKNWKEGGWDGKKDYGFRGARESSFPHKEG